MSKVMIDCFTAGEFSKMRRECPEVRDQQGFIDTLDAAS
jgi:hypothetical protein